MPTLKFRAPRRRGLEPLLAESAYLYLYIYVFLWFPDLEVAFLKSLVGILNVLSSAEIILNYWVLGKFGNFQARFFVC